jgi:hypothetical protein
MPVRLKNCTGHGAKGTELTAPGTRLRVSEYEFEKTEKVENG